MPQDDPSSSEPRHREQFATTHWSLVLAAGDQSDANSHRALEKLCRSYWPPLYEYIRRRLPDSHQAQDLTQAFFERLLEKQYLAQADPQRGRFRAFLITAFKHFLANEWDKAKTKKRGGDNALLPFALKFHEQGDSNLTDELTAEKAYERRWAITLLNRVMRRLQREMERRGNGRQFQCLRDFLGGSNSLSYAAAADAIGINEAAARMAVSRMRRLYRELLHDEIAQTVSSPEEVEDEIRYLFATFEN